MTATAMDGLRNALAPWIETRVETRRNGSTFAVAVNHHTNLAVVIEEGDLEDPRELAALGAQLRREGFLTDGQPPARSTPRRCRASKVDALRTLQVTWLGADAAVRTVHRKGLRLCFHPVAVGAQILFAVVGSVAIVRMVTNGAPVQWRAAPWMLPLLLAIDLFAIAVHELAHALVLVHHGRTVKSAGIGLHLGSPAFFIDSVDGLLLPRRVRILQAAAGPWAEWLVTGAVAIAGLLLPEGAALLVVQRFVVLNSVTVLSNLLPFVGLDGYWLLADATREPMPAERGRKERRLVLDDVRSRRMPRLSSIAWSVFSIGNGAAAVALVAVAGVFWYQRFGSLAGAALRAGPLPTAFAIAVAAFLLRPAMVDICSWTAHRAASVVRRVGFRLERRWRVAGIKALRGRSELAGMTDLQLSIAAGGLVRLDHDDDDFDGLTTAGDRGRVGLPTAYLDYIRTTAP